jgi:hypothetical protein
LPHGGAIFNTHACKKFSGHVIGVGCTPSRDMNFSKYWRVRKGSDTYGH